MSVPYADLQPKSTAGFAWWNVDRNLQDKLVINGRKFSGCLIGPSFQHTPPGHTHLMSSGASKTQIFVPGPGSPQLLPIKLTATLRIADEGDNFCLDAPTWASISAQGYRIADWFKLDNHPGETNWCSGRRHAFEVAAQLAINTSTHAAVYDGAGVGVDVTGDIVFPVTNDGHAGDFFEAFFKPPEDSVWMRWDYPPEFVGPLKITRSVPDRDNFYTVDLEMTDAIPGGRRAWE